MNSMFTGSKKYNILCFLAVLVLSVFSFQSLNAQNTKKQAKKTSSKDVKLYPDEYGELDEVPLPKSTKDEGILKILEKSRQKYLQALIMIEKKDTVAAAKHFEDAINILNPLVSYPNIEKNDDFTELAQSIIEDYESFVTNINNLNENSSLFIFRDKLYQDIEAKKSDTPIKIKPLELKIVDTVRTASSDKTPADTHKFAVPLDDNVHVQKSIDFLLTNKFGKSYIKGCFERSSRWLPIVKRILAEEGMPEELVFLAMTESALNPTVVSKAKAVGMWQFIRSTGALYGLNAKGSVWIDERRNPEKATRAAARHLRDLYNELGDWHLAFAAYNYGIGGVRKSIARSKLDKPTYWELRDYLPKETRGYVPMFIATAKVFMNPKAYGVNLSEFNMQEEYKYETFTIKEPVSTKALAKCANIPVEKFNELNPELISSTTPPDLPEYTIRIPEGSKSGFIASYATLTPEEKQPWITHTVTGKESIASIADKYGISKEELISANSNVAGIKKLKKGTQLRVPIEKSVYEAMQASKSDAKDSSDTDEAELTASAPNKSIINYEVKKNETLFSIAQRYNLDIADIKRWNKIPESTDNINEGTSLKLEVKKQFTKSLITSNQEPQIKKIVNPIVVKHTVRSGETMAQIADDYNVSVEDIRKWNRIENNNIKVGQPLRVVTTNPKNIASASSVKPAPAAKIKKREEEKSAVIASKKVSHKVKKGENLGIIAAKYGVTESEIKKWNPKKIVGKKLLANTKLTLFVDQPQKGSSTSSSKKVNKLPKVYTVRKGDTIKEIADKFGVSVKSLKQKNKGITDSKLKKGQKLKIQ